MTEASAQTAKRPRTTTAERPLSPHLQVYRPLLTMMMSIIHRITGGALYVGSLLIVWWLLALATDAGAYQTASAVLWSWFGKLVLFGFTWALFQHLMGGVRHAIWDMGRGLDHPEREHLALVSAIVPPILTVLVWIVVLAKG